MNILNPQVSKEITKGFEGSDITKECIREQTRSVVKEGRKIDTSIKHLYLCHVTSFPPEKGVIYPRVDYKINLNTGITKFFSVVRPTVHFTVNSVVSEHDTYKKEGNRFLIIDRFEDALKQISGGYLEDIFCIGPYKLSKNAIILAPASCNKKEIEKIKDVIKTVKIIYYEGSEEKSLKEWLNEHGACDIQPISRDPNIPNFLCRFGKDKYLSSQAIMKVANKTFCSHDITPMQQIESCILRSGVFQESPFLGILKKNSYESVCKVINQYIKSIEETFPLNEEQKSFINAYKKSITSALKILAEGKNLKGVEEKFALEQEMILQYDSQVDLEKKIQIQGATTILSELTGLMFDPYYRANCRTIVDAACQVLLRGDVEKREVFIRTLKKATGLDFVIEQHGENDYLVLKGMNVEENFKPIQTLSKNNRSSEIQGLIAPYLAKEKNITPSPIDNQLTFQ